MTAGKRSRRGERSDGGAESRTREYNAEPWRNPRQEPRPRVTSGLAFRRLDFLSQELQPFANLIFGLVAHLIASIGRRWRNSSMARWSRDLTVPSGTAIAVAISGTEKSA
jgi:hypothetical protein